MIFTIHNCQSASEKELISESLYHARVIFVLFKSKNLDSSLELNIFNRNFRTCERNKDLVFLN